MSKSHHCHLLALGWSLSQSRVPERNQTGCCPKRRLGKTPEVPNPLRFHLLPPSHLLPGLIRRGLGSATSPPFPLQRAIKEVLQLLQPQRARPQQRLHFFIIPLLLQPAKGGGLRQGGWWGPGRTGNLCPSLWSENPERTAGQGKWCPPGARGSAVLCGQRAAHFSRCISSLSGYHLSLSPSGTFRLITTNAVLSSPGQFPPHFSRSCHTLQPLSPISPVNPKTQKTCGARGRRHLGWVLWHSIPFLRESWRKQLLGFPLGLPHSCLSFPACFPPTPGQATGRLS